MDIEERLPTIESCYRAALNAAAAAKADYLALADESTSSPPRVARAKSVWQKFETRKLILAAQFEALENSSSG